MLTYSESATARALIPYALAPHTQGISYDISMSCNKKGISSYELSRRLSLPKKTFWSFQRKAQETTRSSGNNPLNGTVEVDKFFVDGPATDKTGRGNGKKKLVVMALQVDAFGIHRSYAKIIANASGNELGAFIHEIAPKATIKTGQWTGYTPSKAVFTNLKQEESEKGKWTP